MMMIQICVGSSCHLKNSERIVEQFQEAVAKHGLDTEIALAGCFCTGHCNRSGVTVTIDEVVHTGVTPEGFAAFFETYVLKPALAERV